MQTAIRVLVVDDSALMRALISEIVSADPKIEVVGTARNGVEAIAKVEKLAPDVVTLDVEMPELGGLAALRRIMRKSPTKVVMLSGVDAADVTYEALSSGAVDFVAKPAGPFSPNIAEVADELLSKIHVAAQANLRPLRARRETERAKGARRQAAKAPRDRGAKAPELRIVAIGASTGGPAAVETVLSGLPADLPAACLVVQHLPAGFSSAFTRRLGRFGRLEVREGKTGDKVVPGVVYVAPAGLHMTVADRPTLGPVIRLDQTPAISGLRPSADRTMESVAKVSGAGSIGVLLTGMGSDGAAGMRTIKQAGGLTIAQDEETSVIYGMPRAAVEDGVVDRVVPLSKVASEIRVALAGGAGSDGR